MMKKNLAFLLAFLLLLTMIGCSDGPNTDMPSTPDAGTTETPDLPETSKLDAIPFDAGQLYGVAYLGYEEMEDLTFYVENYLDHENLQSTTFQTANFIWSFRDMPIWPCACIEMIWKRQNEFCFMKRR